jgi:hypothetical protein
MVTGNAKRSKTRREESVVRESEHYFSLIQLCADGNFILHKRNGGICRNRVVIILTCG